MCSKCKGHQGHHHHGSNIEPFYTRGYEEGGKSILQPNLKKLAGVNIKKIGR